MTLPSIFKIAIRNEFIRHFLWLLDTEFAMLIANPLNVLTRSIMQVLYL